MGNEPPLGPCFTLKMLIKNDENNEKRLSLETQRATQ